MGRGSGMKNDRGMIEKKILKCDNKKNKIKKNRGGAF